MILLFPQALVVFKGCFKRVCKHRVETVCTYLGERKQNLLNAPGGSRRCGQCTPAHGLDLLLQLLFRQCHAENKGQEGAAQRNRAQDERQPVLLLEEGSPGFALDHEVIACIPIPGVMLIRGYSVIPIRGYSVIPGGCNPDQCSSP